MYQYCFVMNRSKEEFWHSPFRDIMPMIDRYKQDKAREKAEMQQLFGMSYQESIPQEITSFRQMRG